MHTTLAVSYPDFFVLVLFGAAVGAFVGWYRGVLRGEGDARPEAYRRGYYDGWLSRHHSLPLEREKAKFLASDATITKLNEEMQQATREIPNE